MPTALSYTSHPFHWFGHLPIAPYYTELHFITHSIFTFHNFPANPFFNILYDITSLSKEFVAVSKTVKGIIYFPFCVLNTCVLWFDYKNVACDSLLIF